MTKEKFEIVKNKFGIIGSFTVWNTDDNDRIYESIGDLSIFEYDNIISLLNDKYVFMCLNPAQRLDENGEIIIYEDVPLSGFHNRHPNQKDYRLRDALKDTKYWGSFITDLFPIATRNSRELDNIIRETPEELQKSVDRFRDYLAVLGNVEKVILVGKKTEKYYKKYFANYFTNVEIAVIPHYSYSCPKGPYENNIIAYRHIVNDKLK